MGRLGGSVIKRPPSAQGMILTFWDRAPHQAPRWEPASSSPTPLLCSLSVAVSLSHK